MQDSLIETNGRMTGNSTRRIDFYIQKLFTEKEVKIQDHYPDKKADKYLFNRVLNRLEFEHNLSKRKEQFEINKLKLTIKFKN